MLCHSSDCSARSHGLVDFLRAEQVELVSVLWLGTGGRGSPPGAPSLLQGVCLSQLSLPIKLLAPRLSQACSLPALHFTMDPTSGVPGLLDPGRPVF